MQIKVHLSDIYFQRESWDSSLLFSRVPVSSFSKSWVSGWTWKLPEFWRGAETEALMLQAADWRGNAGFKAIGRCAEYTISRNFSFHSRNTLESIGSMTAKGRLNIYTEYSRAGPWFLSHSTSQRQPVSTLSESPLNWNQPWEMFYVQAFASPFFLPRMRLCFLFVLQVLQVGWL